MPNACLRSHTRAEVELTGEWIQILDDRDFVPVNDGVDDRLTIFETVENLRLLCHTDTVFGRDIQDGAGNVPPGIPSSRLVFRNNATGGKLLANWRKLQDLGLTARYVEDEAFNRMMRRAASLPLVPPHQVDDVWIMAMNEVDDEAPAFQGLHYNYMDRQTGQHVSR